MKNILSKPFIKYLDSINFDDKSLVEVLKTKDKQFGDYTCNLPLRLSKHLNEKPIDIANKIAEFIKTNFNEYFFDVTSTNPGFVNLFLSKDFIINQSLKFLDPKYKPSFESIEKKKILYEFISANPTGDLHIGHARNAVVGDIVIKTLKYIGHDVDAEYYINDGGKQIEILAESVYFYYAKLNNIETSLTKENVGYHGEEIKNFANKLALENFNIKGNNDEERINSLKEISSNFFLNEIKKLLLKMNIIEIDNWASEKEIINSKTKLMLNKLKSMDAIYEKDNATWIKVKKFGDEKDRVLIKNTGFYTYMVADLAYHMDKYERDYDLIIDLWGKDHHGYEPRIQAGLEAMGYKDKLEVDYISMVQVSNNGEIVKMSKRAGTSFRIKDALKDMDIDVLRYFIVSKSKEQEMEIDISKVTQNDLSNPYYYVQYTNARIIQLIKKFEKEYGDIKILKSFNSLGKEDLERNLMVKMNEFEDIILSINSEREPSLLINYLRELCQDFNSFYSKIKIITDDLNLTNEKLNLVLALKNQLKTIFNIIGINPKDKV